MCNKVALVKRGILNYAPRARTYGSDVSLKRNYISLIDPQSPIDIGRPAYKAFSMRTVSSDGSRLRIEHRSCLLSRNKDRSGW